MFTLPYNLLRGRLERARVDRMFKGCRGRQSGETAAGYRRAVIAITGLCLVPMLSGCIFNERSLLGIEIPDRYRAQQSLPPTAPPALDWWRGFRSRELTGLIEEAQTSNFDIAIAMARIIQADAQSKIAGAPLLPAADFDASVTRSRPRGRTRPHHLADRDHRELRDRFLGQEPRALARGAGERDRRPFRPRRGRDQHRGDRRHRLFPGAVVAGPPADRQPERRGREQRPDA